MLPPPRAADRHWLPTRQRESSRAVAFASALAHVAALALVLRIASPSLPAAPAMTTVTMLFTAPATVAAPAAAPTAVPATASMRPPAMAPVRTEEHAAPVTKLPNPHTRYAVPPTARTLSGAAAEIPVAGPPAAAAVAQPAAAPPPATESAFLLAHFTSDIQAVVRAAAVMPAAARRQHREGRAEVRFDYLDGTVQGVALAQSSASRVLDDAALAAVRTARYPAPPPQLRGRKLSLVVWVDFHLAAASPG